VPGSRDWGASSDWFSLARARFARHRTEKPSTKAGQIRALWPDIDAALQGGQSMKSIRTWLEEDAEVTLSISSLTSYISRIRRRAKRPALPPQAGRNEVARAKRPKTIRLLKPNAF